MEQYALILSLLFAVLLDKIFGDPAWLPHPIVLFGKIIAFFETHLNIGGNRVLKGLITVLILVPGIFLCFLFISVLAQKQHWAIKTIIDVVFIYYGLAGTTLIKEAEMVFEKLAIGINEGRNQVSRIVGRDTQSLNEQQIKAATLETMAENLSDGVIAPLFWFALAGIPGMMCYKMVNTLDSMIGYKSDRYLYFGRCAAILDDWVNFIPARITAFLMALVAGSWRAFRYILKYGKAHSSPNAGYPEAALAGILNAQFGGSNSYFGKTVKKPFIGSNYKEFILKDFKIAKRTNILTEACFIIILLILAFYRIIILSNF